MIGSILFVVQNIHEDTLSQKRLILGSELLRTTAVLGVVNHSHKPNTAITLGSVTL